MPEFSKIEDLDAQTGSTNFKKLQQLSAFLVLISFRHFQMVLSTKILKIKWITVILIDL